MMKENDHLDPQLWVDEFADFLFAFAIKRVNSREDAEDLIQDTFLSACKGLKNFQGKASVKTWLTSILKNKIIDYYRLRSSSKGYDDYLSETEESFGNAFFNENNHGRWKEKIHKNHISENTDQCLLTKEFYEILEYCLQKLPPKLRPVFIAKYMMDDDAKKICKELNITSSNYWVLLFRSKTLLRSCLEKKEITPNA
jgi:RNA polymerase sigma-70 factor (TIGR02943 family)